MALPIYMLLIKNIFQVRSQYNAAQLIPATNKMIFKLKKYLVALEKPAPIFSMILDPWIKLKHLEKNQHFLAEQNITTLTTDDALQLSKFEARVFDCSPSKMQQSELPASHKNKKKKDKLLTIIEANIFGEATIAKYLGVQYIAEVNEKASTDIITYCSQHKKVYTLLALMAKSYLGIPETSAPSEHVFSQSKTIIGPQ
ncbi:uncharacterized protein VP01_4464g2 [Puccinia sorghi]|uniref:HAT C-terminal dimerisation domain-containing protein n=1 Tax=Puccinia sorghi TaxID=27349 RepID=A0A0L6URC3_9BASI|nr:uncharacterized protein VP01_4464g2 [Puccinia sorghi]